MPGEPLPVHVPDADLQAWKVIRSQIRNEGFQPVVPPGPAGLPEAELAHRKRHVIMDNEDLGRHDLVEPGHRRHRPAAQVHVGHRL
jgi:hypothetical protein